MPIAVWKRKFEFRNILSCNAYFAVPFRKIYDSVSLLRRRSGCMGSTWKSFGLGTFLGYDLPTGQTRKRIPNKGILRPCLIKAKNRWPPHYLYQIPLVKERLEVITQSNWQNMDAGYWPIEVIIYAPCNLKKNRK